MKLFCDIWSYWIFSKSINEMIDNNALFDTFNNAFHTHVLTNLNVYIYIK